MVGESLNLEKLGQGFRDPRRAKAVDVGELAAA